jgi:predicted DNA-binding protein (MmcQ/YjbR family)
MPKTPVTIRRLEAAMRDHALRLPEAYEDFPWGERVIKVRKKIFLFLGVGPEGLGFSVKLPQSRFVALSLPFTEPTRYGLGRSGWVTARLRAGEHPPVEVFEPWIEESYRAIAPKRLVLELDRRPGGTGRRTIAKPPTPVPRKRQSRRDGG